jgi:hypothetical protein
VEGVEERKHHVFDGVEEAAVGNTVQEQLLIVVEGDVEEVKGRQGAPVLSSSFESWSRNGDWWSKTKK